MKLIYLLPLLVLFIPASAFAEYSEITITPAAGSGSPGCEYTADGCFNPSVVTINVGDKVIFKNTDGAAHTFTSGISANGYDGVFDSSLVMAGHSFEWSPTEAGDVPYFDLVHPWMTGLIIVQEVESAEDDSDDDLPPVKTLQQEIETLREELDLLYQKLDNLEQIMGAYHPDTLIVVTSPPSSSEGMVVSVVQGVNIPGLGDTINIKVFDAESNVDIQIMSAFGNVIGELYGIITSAGTIEQLWV